MQTLPSILKAPLVGYAFKIQAGIKFAEIDGDSVSSFLIYIHLSFINKIQDHKESRDLQVCGASKQCVGCRFTEDHPLAGQVTYMRVGDSDLTLLPETW